MQSTEEFRPVPGYAGQYEVSNTGVVRSVDRIVYKGQGMTRLQQGRVIALNRHQGGYMIAHLYTDNRRTAKLVHRMVLEAFVGTCPEGMEGCHNDGDPTNNHLSNLRWDTHAENNRDQGRHRTHKESRKTHCPRGHSLVSPNLERAQLLAGGRKCRACGQEYAAARRRGEPFSKTEADKRFALIMQ
ncbi:hypothetical protein J2Y46_002606 [Microbacterium sp. BE35]|uniref:NUMOD4 motif-containing HNH endonuclease n=1 Tax=Microbacterium sp. BE35 TaxID=2817773 RepID=UPI00285FC367|nr:NUMOD4 motif-containing HNH endonuclease [Microbacterium sp. BE35]MDR7189780.1 hypothetical protein [Microbacterium sp. BE35]